MHHDPTAGDLRQAPSSLTACSVIAFLAYVAIYMRLPVFPPFAAAQGLGNTQIGVINAAFFLSAGFSSIPLGALNHALGPKRLAVGGLLVVAGALFFLASRHSYAGFVLAYLLLGLGLAAFSPTMMSLVAEISPSSQLGRSYGWYTLTLYGGMSFGPALGGLLANHYGFAAVLSCSGGMVLLTLLPALRLIPDAGQGAGKILASRCKAPSLAALLGNKPLLGCLVATIGACFGLGMFISFVPLHAQRQGLTLAQVGLVFLAHGLCNALSRIPFGRLSDYVDDRRTLVVCGMLGVACSMLTLGLATTMSTFVAAAMLLGVSMGLCFPSIGALIAESVPRHWRGLAMGSFNSSIFLGLALNAAITGPLTDLSGFPFGFFLTACVSLLLVAAFYLLSLNRDL